VKTYSNDLRERIVEGRAKGETAEALAKRFQVSKRTVERYWKLQQERGSITPKPRGGYRRSVLAQHDAKLKKWIQKEPGLTLVQLGDRLRQRLKINLGITALWHRLEQLGLSYKKNAARRRAGST
jgi:transposase